MLDQGHDSVAYSASHAFDTIAAVTKPSQGIVMGYRVDGLGQCRD